MGQKSGTGNKSKVRPARQHVRHIFIINVGHFNVDQLRYVLKKTFNHFLARALELMLELGTAKAERQLVLLTSLQQHIDTIRDLFHVIHERPNTVAVVW